jgi:hypothetical protein
VADKRKEWDRRDTGTPSEHFESEDAQTRDSPSRAIDFEINTAAFLTPRLSVY